MVKAEGGCDRKLLTRLLCFAVSHYKFHRAMELSLPLRFSPPAFSLISQSPIKYFTDHQTSTISQPIITPKLTFSPPRRTNRFVVTAKRKKRIDGVSEELNLIASQNLDFAPARRRVRSAFVEVQQKLDHCLFKVGFVVFLLLMIFVFKFIIVHLYWVMCIFFFFGCLYDSIINILISFSFFHYNGLVGTGQFAPTGIKTEEVSIFAFSTSRLVFSLK